jgi:pilus assembly protein CpaD
MTRSRISILAPGATGILRILALLAAAGLTACQHDQQITGIADPAPADYRQRHPIAIKESDRTVELFIGRGRGSLSPVQQADVAAFAHAWRRESSGGIIIDVPAGTANAYAANDALTEVEAILRAAGVPPDAMRTQPYQPADPKIMANVKLRYPKMTAQAGPCGLWPEDIGTSNRKYLENGQHWNFGCAAQRNLAAMVENPADLVQPRGETPTYAGRRSTVLDKYRKGEPTVTRYEDKEKGKISDVGK